MVTIKTIYGRIGAALIIVGGIFLVLFLILVHYKSKLENQIVNSSRQQYKNEVNSLLTLNSSAMKRTVADYTYWDEFVFALNNNDTGWYKTNITILSTFNFEYLCVYNSKFEIVHEVPASIAHSKIVLPREAVTGLKQSRFSHFYLATDQGIMEVSAASVHPTNDPKHTQTEPSGYLFVLRLLNEQFFTDLASISGSKVTILSASDSITGNNPGMLQARLPLRGIDGKPISMLGFSREVNLNFSEMQNILYIVLIYVILALLTANTIARKIVNKPLKLVTDILKTDNHQSIAVLKTAPGEYAQIGQLFEEYVTQKEELKLAKDNAEKADRLKTEFLRNMSHEIRTPMNGIMGFSDLLNEPDIAPEAKQEYTNIIIRNSVQLLRIIDDILEISSLETKQVRIHNAETDLSRLLADLNANFSLKAKEKNLSLHIENKLTDDESIILVDQSKLLKILNNLVENALKFTKTGFVEVGCQIFDDKLLFHVKDTGIGILKEKFDRIFKRFSQADDTISLIYGGLGLGLSIAYENVELLGGQINVDSDPGFGSTFSFTIPYNPVIKVEQIYTQVYKFPNLKSDHTILIAEDDATNYRYLEILLMKMNPDFLLIRATDGRQAIEKCRLNPKIDLVLMDIQLPLMDGYEAIKQIKQFRKELPIIAQSAYSKITDVNKAKEAGCDDYISKPISMEELFRMMTKYLPE